MYTDLKTYQQSVIIHDFTVEFVKKYIDRKSRTCDQMEQAARSVKQNIVEGSSVSQTSPKNELFLLGVARGSLKELLEDYQDFLRQKGLSQWNLNDLRAREFRQLGYRTDKSYKTYKVYMSNPEQAANAMITLINQTTYLLDRQIGAIRTQLDEQGIELETQNQKIKRSLSQAHRDEGGFWEEQKKNGTIRLLDGRFKRVDDVLLKDLETLELDESWLSREDVENMIRNKYTTE